MSICMFTTIILIKASSSRINHGGCCLSPRVMKWTDVPEDGCQLKTNATSGSDDGP